MRRTPSTHIPLFLALGLSSLAGSPASGAIPDRIITRVVTLPAALEPNQTSWCTWGSCNISPRLYHAPLADGRTLVGWTDASLNGHVSVLSGGTLTTTFDFPARPVRGLVGHDDGSFAVLLWDRGGAAPEDDIMWISRRSASGVELWAARATSASNIPSEASAHVGDSRLAYGGGVYGAYLSVHAISGFAAGHEGDEYTRVTDSGSPAASGWSWGLSHSMAQLVAFHPGLSALTTVGCSDCFPAKGLYTGTSRQLMVSDANCSGLIQVQLGQMAAAAGDRWLVAFNEVDRPGFPAQGIGLARFGATGSASVMWLTATTGAEERDPVLARIGTSTGSNRYLVGWRLQTSGEFRLAIVDTVGAILEGPALLGPTVQWGNRDDSFRTRPDGSVSWVQGIGGSPALRLYRYSSSTVDVASPTGNLAFEIEPAFPNPLLTGVMRIRFRTAAAVEVTARVVDTSGRLVRELRAGAPAAGAHEILWDGRDAGGAFAKPGLYFCIIEAGATRRTQKVVVAR